MKFLIQLLTIFNVRKKDLLQKDRLEKRFVSNEYLLSSGIVNVVRELLLYTFT